MKTAQKNATGHRIQQKPGMSFAQEIHKLIMDNLDNLLPRLNALNNLLSDRLLTDLLNKFPRYLEVHIRLQKRHPHLPQRVRHVGVADFPHPAQISEHLLQFSA